MENKENRDLTCNCLWCKKVVWYRKITFEQA